MMSTFSTSDPDDARRQRIAARFQALGRNQAALSARTAELAELHELSARSLFTAAQAVLDPEAESHLDIALARVKEAQAKQLGIMLQCQQLAKPPGPFDAPPPA